MARGSRALAGRGGRGAAPGRPLAGRLTIATGVLTFERLKAGSFTHSVVYLGLLVAWLVPGLHGPTTVLGWAHGLGWIAMSLLAVAAVTRRVISLRLGVAIAILGAVGPFIGSAEFVRESRVRAGGGGR